MSAVLVWLRHDLRVRDNAALSAALATGQAVVPVHVWSPAAAGVWAPGAASRVWLHHALAALDGELRELGLRLILRRGDALAQLRDLARECAATALHWNRRYEPWAVALDSRIKTALRGDGVQVCSHPGALLNEPMTVANREGQPFRVFTPFWRHCRALAAPVVLGAPTRPAPAPARWPSSDRLAQLQLLPTTDWHHGVASHWTISEKGGHARLAEFAETAADAYERGRDLPGIDGVSRLSPYLHFGQLSPGQIWHVLRREPGGADAIAAPYLRQLYWRDFAHHLLHHFPHTADAPLNSAFEAFPWQEQRGPAVRAWERGETGYPLVDAGMRELWACGWMHNRVRMNAGSLLVKHLLTHWRVGARWFWDTLVDADLANNSLGWQWVAGCGADAAPYFRIFNPVLQGQRFDADGRYVRRWIPELAGLPDAYLHAPWTASAALLRDHGVRLDGNYPRPVVAHSVARERALAALRSIKRA